MITAASLIALSYFNIEYTYWIFVITVIQDLAICSAMRGLESEEAWRSRT